MDQNGNTDLSDLHQDGKKTMSQVSDSNEEKINKEWQETSKKPEEIGKEFSELKTKYEELEDQYKRLWADQQNMLNRFNRDKQDLLKYAASNTLETILPALDNFDFAKKSINSETSFDEILKSIDMLQLQLLMSLKAVGLEEIDSSGIFNPELHEAVSHLKDPEKPEGTILEVLKKGFKVKDKVLRVATVVVSSKE
jgi:molecular chaperone GrpE